jgi:hypothetical protein
MTPDFWSIFIVLAMTHADGQAFVLHDQVQSFAQDKSVHDHHPRHPAGRAGELSSEPHICAQYARLLSSESGNVRSITFCLVTDYERKFVLGVATRQDLEVVFSFFYYLLLCSPSDPILLRYSHSSRGAVSNLCLQSTPSHCLPCDLILPSPSHEFALFSIRLLLCTGLSHRNYDNSCWLSMGWYIELLI